MRIAPFYLVFLLTLGCQSDGPQLKPLDLNDYDLPITIQAPDSAMVLEKKYPFMRDITIRRGDHYDIQIFEMEPTSPDAAGEKLRQLDAVREDPFFKEVIREEECGFIFSRWLDSTQVAYDFRYIKIIEGKELIFQTGLVKEYSLSDVKRMYKAIK
jgi:hypothetical protein